MRNPRSFSSNLFATALRALLGLLILAGVTITPRSALAAGTVAIANLSPQEEGEGDKGKWKLKMTINYGGTPHLAYIPMIFSFTPTVLYERSLTDQSPEKPVIIKMPLSNQQGIHESMDVGFSDGTGKVFTTTKFDFVVRRDRGFEAGEYTLVIKRAGDGVTMGQPQRLRLLGDNPIVDRRAIVFSGEKKREAKTEKKEESGEAKAGEGEAKKTEEAASEKPSEESSAAAETPTEAPPAEAPKQGGCGCRVAGSDADVPAGGASGDLGAGALSAAVVLGLAMRRRRRAVRCS
jgi:hypothetical protein